MKSFFFNLWVLSGLTALTLVDWVLQEPNYQKAKTERAR
jgi:hypothetical protein